MALETGTASGYRDFYRKMMNFITANATLVTNNDEWEIKRGYFDPDIDYITSLQWEEDGILNHDVCTAMGWDDTYRAQQEGVERKISWLARLTDAPNYIGFSSTTAVSPTYYTIQPRYWLGEDDESDRCPTAWTLEYSDDGTIWNISDTETETAWAAYDAIHTYTVTETTAHKYWRLNITANNGDATYVEIGRLRFYDVGDTWISRGYTPEYLLKAPGWAGTDPMYMGIRFHIDPNNYYCIEWMGSIGYDELYGWEGQPFMIKSKFTPLWEFDMDYWFKANGATWIMVMNVGERWVATYNGKYFPLGTVAQYPYPVLISGSSYSAVAWSIANGVGHVQGLYQTSGGSSAGSVYSPDNRWVSMGGSSGLGTDYGIGTGYIAPSILSGKNAGERQMPDGAYVLAPYIIEIAGDAYGQLDGIRWISGDNQIPGNIIEDENGQEWLVFCNHHFIDINNFAVLELN